MKKRLINAVKVLAAVMAMVICLSGCGKITEEDITSACANAMNVELAIRKYMSDNLFTDDFTIPYYASNFDFFTDDKEGSCYFTFDGYSVKDLSPYLGTEFEGYCYVVFSEYGLPDYVLWFESKEGFDKAINEIYGPLTQAEMRRYAEEGILVGSFPMETVLGN